MHGCSPLELLQIQRSCRRFYWILKYHPRSWQASRRQMDPPIPDPPFVTSSGNWSEAAYATLIFGTGICAVRNIPMIDFAMLIRSQICGLQTSTVPCSFALRLRFCSVRERLFIYQIKVQPRILQTSCRGKLTRCASTYSPFSYSLKTTTENLTS